MGVIRSSHLIMPVESGAAGFAALGDGKHYSQSELAGIRQHHTLPLQRRAVSQRCGSTKAAICRYEQSEAEDRHSDVKEVSQPPLA